MFRFFITIVALTCTFSMVIGSAAAQIPDGLLDPFVIAVQERPNVDLDGVFVDAGNDRWFTKPEMIPGSRLRPASGSAAARCRARLRVPAASSGELSRTISRAVFSSLGAPAMVSSRGQVR